MFDWWDDFINNFAEDVQYVTDYLDDIAGGLDDLINNLNSYIQFSTMYIWISGITLFVLFVMLSVALQKIGKISKDQEVLQSDMKNLLERLSPELTEKHNENNDKE